MKFDSMNRRHFLRTGAAVGVGLAAPMHFIRGAYADKTSCNMPKGNTITFGWNVPLTGEIGRAHV